MNKERIKSFILILLILNSVHLTIQLWFDSNLLPQGYGFFDFVKNSSLGNTVTSWFNSGGGHYSGEQLYTKTMKPRRTVVNGGGAREIYIRESDAYNQAMQYVDAVLSDMNDENVLVRSVDYEEWKNLFKAKSLYVDYGYIMDYSCLNKLYGLSSSAGKFRQALNFSGFLLVPDNVTNSCSVFTLNEKDNTVLEHSFLADTSSLMHFIEDTTYKKQQNDTFAFEINLDVFTSTEEEIERKVAFSPLTLLTIPTEIEMDEVLQSNRVFENDEEFEFFSEKVLNAFGYNASSLRKSVQSDGTIRFVENKATITFYTDGTIEYKAVAKENGLKMSKESPNAYQAVCDVLNVSSTVWEKSGLDVKNYDYQLVSDLIDNKDNKYTVKINNMFNGTAINYSSITNNAISANVEDGYITKLILHLSNITKTGQQIETTPVLMAIDTVYAHYGDKDMVIDDVYKCYDFDKSGKGMSKWAFKIRNDESILLMDMSN